MLRRRVVCELVIVPEFYHLSPTRWKLHQHTNVQIDRSIAEAQESLNWFFVDSSERSSNISTWIRDSYVPSSERIQHDGFGVFVTAVKSDWQRACRLLEIRVWRRENSNRSWMFVALLFFRVRWFSGIGCVLFEKWLVVERDKCSRRKWITNKKNRIGVFVNVNTTTSDLLHSVALSLSVSHARALAFFWRLKILLTGSVLFSNCVFFFSSQKIVKRKRDGWRSVYMKLYFLSPILSSLNFCLALHLSPCVLVSWWSSKEVPTHLHWTTIVVARWGQKERRRRKKNDTKQRERERITDELDISSRTHERENERTEEMNSAIVISYCANYRTENA